MRRFLIALQFLTVFPFNVKGKIEEEDFGRALLYFPIVGLLLGIFLSAAAHILAFLPSLVMSVILLTAWTAMTGGVHLDGFADTCDGLYGGRSREEALKIMCDSRIGTMGAAGVALLLIFKFAVLSSMQPECLWKTLIMAPLFARWSQGLACSISKYAREEGKAKYFIEHAKRSDVSIGALFTLAVSWLLFGGGGIVLFAVLAATISLFMQYVKGRIGGMTGDTIGATNEVAEAAALFFSLILMSHKI